MALALNLHVLRMHLARTGARGDHVVPVGLLRMREAVLPLLLLELVDGGLQQGVSLVQGEEDST